jgi:hypothetical protein
LIQHRDIRLLRAGRDCLKGAPPCGMVLAWCLQNNWSGENGPSGIA